MLHLCLCRALPNLPPLSCAASGLYLGKKEKRLKEALDDDRSGSVSTNEVVKGITRRRVKVERQVGLQQAKAGTTTETTMETTANSHADAEGVRFHDPHGLASV